MTLPTLNSSPNCVVRSLEQQLEATVLHKDDHCTAGVHSEQDSARYGTPSTKRKKEETLRPMETASQQVPATTTTAPLKDVRDLIFQLCARTGSLSTLFCQNTMPLDHDHDAVNSTTPISDQVIATVVQLMQQLMDLSTALAIDLGQACYAKIELNNRKYPVDLCKVRPR